MDDFLESGNDLDDGQCIVSEKYKNFAKNYSLIRACGTDSPGFLKQCDIPWVSLR